MKNSSGERATSSKQGAAQESTQKDSARRSKSSKTTVKSPAKLTEKSSVKAAVKGTKTLAASPGEAATSIPTKLSTATSSHDVQPSRSKKKTAAKNLIEESSLPLAQLHDLRLRVGMSGWTHAPWRGHFYPDGLPQSQELRFASRQVNSIEVNGTFYATQKPQTFQKWHDETPDDFCFAVKATRFITHIRRLKEVDHALSNFLASGLLCLGPKLGPILWQFPPNVMLKDERFENFMAKLPHDSVEAAKLASNHTSHLDGRAFFDVTEKFPVRHAFEFRHPSFENDVFLQKMKDQNVAVVFADSGKNSPVFTEITSDFIYVRMHGEDKRYESGHTPGAINDLAEKITLWSGQRLDTFVYFDTEAKDFAPQDALKLLKRCLQQAA